VSTIEGVLEWLTFTNEENAWSVVKLVVAAINDCPDEQGIDYEGEVCPQCPVWSARDGWTGRTTRR
jgi:hypothetical protein